MDLSILQQLREEMQSRAVTSLSPVAYDFVYKGILNIANAAAIGAELMKFSSNFRLNPGGVNWHELAVKLATPYNSSKWTNQFRKDGKYPDGKDAYVRNEIRSLAKAQGIEVRDEGDRVPGGVSNAITLASVKPVTTPLTIEQTKVTSGGKWLEPTNIPVPKK